jgi:hypothetical protein
VYRGLGLITPADEVDTTSASSGQIRNIGPPDLSVIRAIGGSLFFLCTTRALQLGQQIAELAVVDLHAIVEVKVIELECAGGPPDALGLSQLRGHLPELSLDCSIRVRKQS